MIGALIRCPHCQALHSNEYECPRCGYPFIEEMEPNKGECVEC